MYIPRKSCYFYYCHLLTHTHSSEYEVIDRFYEELRGAIESIPQHNVIAIIGDFNAPIGKDDGTFTYHQHTNRNGSLLLDIFNEK